MLDVDKWIAKRMGQIEASGIRRAFDLSKSMKDPINLSIGLPDFDVPQGIQESAFKAISSGHNAYTLTTGLPALQNELQAHVEDLYGHEDRKVMVTSGTSGGLLLAICCVVDPGDEVILFDPYFVMYKNLVALAGGVPVLVDTYPDDFRITVEAVSRAITPRTKCVIVNSPGNPSGAVAGAGELANLSALCQERGLLLISDEVYRSFCYDEPFRSPASWNPEVLVVDGYSKSQGMTGWRLGYAHGPSALIQEMAKLQQFSFVCAPAPLQKAVVGAINRDLSAQTDAYRRKRDRVVQALSGRYELSRAEGAFYAFPKVPEKYGSATEFVAEAARRRLLIIAGNVFSQRDSHFRLSYAVDDKTLDEGLDVLLQMA